VGGQLRPFDLGRCAGVFSPPTGEKPRPESDASAFSRSGVSVDVRLPGPLPAPWLRRNPFPVAKLLALQVPTPHKVATNTFEPERKWFNGTCPVTPMTVPLHAGDFVGGLSLT
jgi:hypothetical protein